MFDKQDYYMLLPVRIFAAYKLNNRRNINVRWINYYYDMAKSRKMRGKHVEIFITDARARHALYYLNFIRRYWIESLKKESDPEFRENELFEPLAIMDLPQLRLALDWLNESRPGAEGE